MCNWGTDAELREFRARTMNAVSPKSTPGDPQRAWRDLTDGRSSIVDSFTTPQCAYLVITHTAQQAPAPQRGLLMLERVLMGGCPKVVAADFDISLSTIASVMKQTLEHLGSKCLPSKAPLGLVALTYAARSTGPQPRIFSGAFQCAGTDYEVYMTLLPSLSHLLPPAVEDVVRLHAAGKTHREIANVRGRSARTVANQLATAFNRTGHSGRLSLLEFILSQEQHAREFEQAT